MRGTLDRAYLMIYGITRDVEFINTITLNDALLMFHRERGRGGWKSRREPRRHAF